MRIKHLVIDNFKRFTHLELLEIPPSAKLVLLIGSNGSGKSCVFDAFQWIKSGGRGQNQYFVKKEGLETFVKIEFQEGKKLGYTISNSGSSYENGHFREQFYGRSSNRILPRIPSIGNPSDVETDGDAPNFYIDPDNRFQNDVFKYISDINKALREPVFQGKSADTVEIFRQFVDPVNQALQNVLGSNNKTAIQLLRFEDAPTPNMPSKLLFKKGEVEINYDLLSHGEKQVVTLLLNFIVRRNYHQDSIYFIDEMDVHLNTALQYAMLKEIVENWIPDNCQLWTASHSLGFIQFAKDSGEAIIFDFDELDFDEKQVLQPLAVDHPEIYEIAVGAEFLSALVKHYKMFFVENTDKEKYASVNLPNCMFIEANNRDAVFNKVRTLDEFMGIVDRDYLTEEDIELLRKHYPRLYILPYYSIENLLFHPDNLAEYYKKLNIEFDRDSYIRSIREAKNNVIDKIALSLVGNRADYPYFKEPAFETNKKLRERFLKDKEENKVQSEVILKQLKSDDFVSFYPSFSMKAYGSQIPEKQNVKPNDLIKTNWFSIHLKKILSL